jgi:hypothetical protein
MSAEFREQIYANPNLKDSEDLLDIWEANDHTEWSDIAFEVIREILTGRGIDIPEQGDATEHDKELPGLGDDTDGLEDWEANLLDNEDQPEFFNTLDVLDLHHKLNRIAQASIVVYALFGFSNLPIVSTVLNGNPPTMQDLTRSIVPAVYNFLGYGLQILITFFSLRALGSVLRILMEMEFNSRCAK